MALAFAAAGCHMDADDGREFAPGPAFSQRPSEFEDTWDLVRAIEDGSFAKRADLRDELAAVKPLPDAIRVPFVSGTEVPEEEHGRLERFAELIRSEPDIALRVIGCSDPPGSSALNLRISKQRAESVAAELEQLGIAEERFEQVVGRGEECETPERAVNVVPIRGERQVARAG